MKLYQKHHIQAWEEAWFAHSVSFGLMTQAAWQMANVIHAKLLTHKKPQGKALPICVWCGVGNNGGDGYLLAHYLNLLGAGNYHVQIYAPFGEPRTADAQQAKATANIKTLTDSTHLAQYTVHIDGLFGIGLDRQMSVQWQAVIEQFNALSGYKIAIDMPSGLHADTGMPMPVAVRADMTLTLIGAKVGLYIAQGKSHTGEVICLPLLPPFILPSALPSIDMPLDNELLGNTSLCNELLGSELLPQNEPSNNKLIPNPKIKIPRKANADSTGSTANELDEGDLFFGQGITHNTTTFQSGIPTPITAIATLTDTPTVKPRSPHAHKGNFGHIAIIGGHTDMGGAVMMAGLSAMASGAGKVSVLSHPCHHGAILTHAPNLMVKDIQSLSDTELAQWLSQVDGVAFGMGLGRDAWAKMIFDKFLPILLHPQADNPSARPMPVLLDADALYHLADWLHTTSSTTDNPPSNQSKPPLPSHIYLTPHHGEAARLLGITAGEVASDVITAITTLQQRYGGQWVLKGAGALSLENHALHVCPFGNAGMATAGMGDVLSGMGACLLSQHYPLCDVVALHALAGDELAKTGQIGILAQDMPTAIAKVMNGLVDE